MLAIVAVNKAENGSSEVCQNLPGSRRSVATGTPRLLLALSEGVMKRFFDRSWQILANFRRSVLGCIDSYDSENRRIFQLFSRSTRLAHVCTAPNSTFFFSQHFNKFSFKNIRVFVKNAANFVAKIQQQQNATELLVKICNKKKAKFLRLEGCKSVLIL